MQRYHAFDSLRGWMMLLGVVIHAATAYARPEDIWWLKDSRTSLAMDALVVWLHAFRLPAFFVMAGFFACMLVERRGASGFLKNRLTRLGVPFLFGMVVLYPLLRPVGTWNWYLRHGGNAVERTYVRLVENGFFWKQLEPMHLWFLLVLMVLCAAAAPLAPWLNRVRTPLGRWRFVPLAAISFLTLLPMSLGLLDTPEGFLPEVRILGAYAVFFVFGWALYRQREELEALRGGGWLEIGAGALVTAPAVYGLLHNQPVLTAACAALTAWLTIQGLLGLFLRHASEPSPRGRFLSDAAYFVYMVHPVVLVAMQIPLLSVPLPAEVKFALVALAGVPACLALYQQVEGGEGWRRKLLALMTGRLEWLQGEENGAGTCLEMRSVRNSARASM